MSWLSLLGVILGIAKLLLQKAADAKQLEAGEASGIAKQMEDINARVAAASAARSGKLPDDADDPNNRDPKQ